MSPSFLHPFINISQLYFLFICVGNGRRLFLQYVSQISFEMNALFWKYWAVTNRSKICIFLKIHVLAGKKKFSLFFLRNSWADRAESFSITASAKFGCVLFFFLWNLVAIKFERFYKIRNISKSKVFDKVFSILLLLKYGNDIFQNKKKRAPRLRPSCHTKSFSSK